jgi:hypothetical protein
LQCRKAAWHAGEAPAGGLGRWKDREVTCGRGEKQEVGAGDQGRFTAPAAEAPGAEQRGQGRQEEEGGRIELGTVSQYQRKAGTSL